jgi:8-oxo-dGTP pyrophosphatase MutT (NUDIX family)
MIDSRLAAARPTPALLVRTCALIIHAQQVCLIRHQRPTGDHYSVPGGIVHTGETVPAALARELKEELNLDVASLPHQPALHWAQDQRTTRPGNPEPFRRLHLVHLLQLPGHVRDTLAAAEQTVEDHAPVVWVGLARAAQLPLYPVVAPVLAALPDRRDPEGLVLPPPMTDRTCRWR